MRTPTSRTDRAAFTLLELTLVVLIMGVVTSLVFVKLDSFLPGQRLRGVAARVIGAAELARSEARLKRTFVSLQYDLDNSTWSIVIPAPPPEEEDAGQYAENGLETIELERLPEGITISKIYYSESGVAVDGSIAADFRPSGAVGEHMVVLEETPGGTISVYVPALSGAAFVVEKGVSYEQVRSRRRLE